MERTNIKKSINIGRVEVKFEWRSKHSLMGRFGGGWNWDVGFQVGSRSVVTYWLIFMIRFDIKDRPEEQAKKDKKWKETIKYIDEQKETKKKAELEKYHQDRLKQENKSVVN